MIVEFQYDGRSENPLVAPISVADNDLMTGLRLAMNDAEDTSVFVGTVTDLQDGSMSGIIEATRRFGDV